jgi:hypothetical protein
MSEMTLRYDTAIVKVMDGIRIDGWWEGERVADQSVFEFGDEFGFPA